MPSKLNMQNKIPDRVENFLTLDFEEWYEAEVIWSKLGKEPKSVSRLDEQVNIFLDVCNETGIKSTCFATGKTAEKYPRIISKISESGHEIASHSYDHRLVYLKTPKQFREDLIKSIKLLEDITSLKVIGYRAPSWSVNASIAKWFYEILQENGILYSSSVYPAKTYLYGMSEAPSGIHRISSNGIIEIPQQLINLQIYKFGFAGGAYLRMLPSALVKKIVRYKNQHGMSVVIYVHPWELIQDEYKIKLSFFENLIQRHGINGFTVKLRIICNEFADSFVRMGDYVQKLNTTYESS